MAIINCPVCGKSVSDKGKDCIYCGSLLSSGAQNSLNDEIACPECGTYIPKDNERCEVCGCPLQADIAVTDKDKKKSKKTEKPKKEKAKKVKPKKEKVKKEKTEKELLTSEKKIFNICSIVSLVMSELSLAAAIVIPIIAIVVTINHNTDSFNSLYFCGICFEAGHNWGYESFWYRDETDIVLALVIPLVCRFGFIAAHKIFEKKAQKAERKLERLIEEEKSVKTDDTAE